MIKRLSAILLALLLVLPPLTGTAAPADTTWHVNWMQEAKLVRGRGTGLELDAIVTRAEMAAFLQRVLECRRRPGRQQSLMWTKTIGPMKRFRLRWPRGRWSWRMAG